MSLQYLIDTDWVVHYFKGRQAIVKRLDALENESLAISVATLAELYDAMPVRARREGHRPAPNGLGGAGGGSSPGRAAILAACGLEARTPKEGGERRAPPQRDVL